MRLTEVITQLLFWDGISQHAKNLLHTITTTITTLLTGTSMLTSALLQSRDLLSTFQVHSMDCMGMEKPSSPIPNYAHSHTLIPYVNTSHGDQTSQTPHLWQTQCSSTRDQCSGIHIPGSSHSVCANMIQWLTPPPTAHDSLENMNFQWHLV